METIKQINGQFKITLSKPKVLLMCDSEHYYSEPRVINKGITWAGRPVQLFDTIEAAQNYISANNLILYVDEGLI